MKSFLPASKRKRRKRARGKRISILDELLNSIFQIGMGLAIAKKVSDSETPLPPDFVECEVISTTVTNNDQLSRTRRPE